MHCLVVNIGLRTHKRAIAGHDPFCRVGVLQRIGSPPSFAETGTKRMATIVLNVQRQLVCAKQFALQEPRLEMLYLTHQSILIQPRIEPLLALVRERQPKGRALGVPLQMVHDPLAEMLAAALVLWRYADV